MTAFPWLLHAHQTCTPVTRQCASDWLPRANESTGGRSFVRPYLWGSGNYLFHMVKALRREFPEYSNFVDVGAAEYPGTAGDLSLAMHMYSLWGRRARVFGFEPDANNSVYSRAATTGGAVQIRSELVSNHTGTVTMFIPDDNQNKATTNARLVGMKGGSIYGSLATMSTRALPCTTIDYLASSRGIETVHILKTDTEGTEWEVLRGAAGLLARGRIRVLLVAYESNWNMDSWLATKRGGARVVAPSVSAMGEPSLRSVTRHLSSLNYSSYLVGFYGADLSGLDGSGLIFIPLSGPCWDDALELARDPQSEHYIPFVYSDVVAVPAGSLEEQMIDRLTRRHAPPCGPRGGKLPVGDAKADRPIGAMRSRHKKTRGAKRSGSQGARSSDGPSRAELGLRVAALEEKVLRLSELLRRAGADLSRPAAE